MQLSDPTKLHGLQYSSTEESFEQGKELENGRVVLKLAIFYRSVALQILNSFRYLVSPSEPSKIAIHQNRYVAVLRLGIHFLPLIAALTLIILNARKTMIADSESLSILQFVAKVHEVLMQASITAMVLAYIRRQVTRKRSAPFGSLFSGIQIANISHLWSLEFTGILSAPWMSVWKRLEFGVVISAAILLAATVGPSSAILMLPRQSLFASPRTRDAVVLGTLPLLPISLKVGMSCTPNANIVLGHISSESRTVNYRRFTHRYASGHSTVYDNTSGHIVGSRAHTTVPFITFGDMAEFISLNRSTEVRFESKVASVASFCGTPILVNNTSSSIDFPLPDGTTVSDVVTQTQVLDSRTDDAKIQFLVKPPPAPYAGNISLLVLLTTNDTLQYFEAPRQTNFTGLTATPCSIKAFWPDARVNITLGDDSIIDWRLKNHDFPDDNERQNESGQSRSDPFSGPDSAIEIDSEWIKELLLDVDIERNDSITGLSTIAKAFPKLTRLSKMGEESPDSPFWEPDYTSHLSQAFTALIASGMVTMSCRWRDCPNLIKRKELVENGAIKNHRAEISHEELAAVQDDHYMIFRMRGYTLSKGYVLDSWPAILASCVLAVYCLIVLGFIILSMLTGVSSSSWDSASEVAALALYSKVPKLGNMSAGLGTINVFRQRVSIMENTSHDLELVFKDEVVDKAEQSGYQELKYNKWY